MRETESMTKKLMVIIKLKILIIIYGWDKNPDKKGFFEGNQIINKWIDNHYVIKKYKLKFKVGRKNHQTEGFF